MTYEFDGNKYEKASMHQTNWGQEMVEGLRLEGNERILDIGCGDGRVTQKIALRVPEGEVLGIDASHGMIAAAKKYECENLSFKVMAVNELSFHEHFDIVFSHAALHWVRGHGNLYKIIHAALRPDGYARLNFAGDGACPTLILVIREVMAHDEYTKYFTKFSWPWYMPAAIEYQKIISGSPFRNINVSEERKERIFPWADAMIKWIDDPCLVPFLAVIDENDQRGFREMVIDRMLKRTKQPGGGFQEVFCRLDVFAKK